MQLDQRRLDFLGCAGHTIVTGGPGSGKTTIAIMKAAKIADDRILETEQKIIFLSFARSTISRVFQAIQENPKGFSRHAKSSIQVETYHSFFWTILKTHGYLLGLPKRLTILPKPEESIRLSKIRNQFPKSKRTDSQQAALDLAVSVEKRRLAYEDGFICFDQFVEVARNLILGSQRIRDLVMDKYPIIILDEFQDTSDEHWAIIQSLGEKSELIALADPDQRIYDFLGADPLRLDHFRTAFTPHDFSFQGDNFRSGGTDIIDFGRDLLAQNIAGKAYQNVVYDVYPRNKNQAYHRLKLQTIIARKRLIDQGKRDWSLAILVPTISLMKTVSQLFASTGYHPATIEHTNAISKEGPILSSYVIARLMESGDKIAAIEDTLGLLEDYYRGRAGDKVTKGNLDAADKVRSSVPQIMSSLKEGKRLSAVSVTNKLKCAMDAALTVDKTGDPLKDWLLIRQCLEDSNSKHFQDVVQDAKELQLLGRGAELRAMLSEDWLRNSDYPNALDIVQKSFVQEHFAKGSKPETGVVVMNMHKSKGKQFDEVIVFEDWFHVVDGEIKNPGNRICHVHADPRGIQQARYNLYVSATRAKQRTTIMTPEGQVCPFLI